MGRRDRGVKLERTVEEKGRKVKKKEFIDINDVIMIGID